MAISKEQILIEIRRTAIENGGKPLGTNRFEKETGIKPYDWSRYWARFGDAQKEAGFSANVLQVAHTNEFVMEKIIGLMRKMKKFPTLREIEVERNSDPELPSLGTFRRLGSKEQLATKVIEYCKSKDGYNDITELCKLLIQKEGTKENPGGSKNILGSVYLFKSGKYYKIGKTKDTVRRGNELKIQLPEDLDLKRNPRTESAVLF